MAGTQYLMSIQDQQIVILSKTIDKLEATVSNLSNIANSITYEMQSNNFKITRNTDNILDLNASFKEVAILSKELERAATANETKLAVVIDDIRSIEEALKELKTTLSTKYVNVDQFSPIQKIVYAITGLLLTGIIGSMLNLVIRK